MIELRNVTKYYRVNGRRKIILDAVNVHFETGTSYALLGVNGAGKSTTMRLLAGSELPNSGKVRTDVNVSWPMGFASGFNAAMSGKDNLKFVARAYGADPRLVAEFVDDFAELGDYINQPVRTYSSGMAARLAFGLSMAIEFDCYLIDEITAVGDARFQERCRQAFNLRRQSADMIVISHSMNTIEKFCDKAFVLVDGQLVAYNRLEDAIEMYYRLNR